MCNSAYSGVIIALASTRVCWTSMCVPSHHIKWCQQHDPGYLTTVSLVTISWRLEKQWIIG